jgi:hypothetical protein
MADLQKELKIVGGRPIPKDPLAFFEYKKGSRIMLNITDSPSVWKADLSIAESFFADMIICPINSNIEEHANSLTIVHDVLQQRSRYPGVKDDPELGKIAKIWILPNKVHLGPAALSVMDDSQEALKLIFESLKTEYMIHVLKIEVCDGKEREILYKFLDQPTRPSLILVKWSEDLDDHMFTANCAGHIQNVGYALIGFENGYGLYMFRDQPLYDICSMKVPSLTNPIMDSIIQSVSDKLRPSTTTTTSAPTGETNSST